MPEGLAAGGSGVACKLRMTGIPGLPAYELDDLYGYNAGDGLVHEHWGVFDTMTMMQQLGAVPDGPAA